MVPRKAAKLENPVKIVLKCPLWSIAAKLENVRTKAFLQIYGILSNFDSNPLICDPTLFPGKNSPNIAESNCLLRGNGKGDSALILTHLNNLMAEGFFHHCFSFSISVIFRGKRVVKVGPKVQTLVPSLFHKNSNPSNFFQIMFLFARVLLPLVKISAILDHISAIKGPKTSQKRWIGTWNFENF